MRFHRTFLPVATVMLAAFSTPALAASVTEITAGTGFTVNGTPLETVTETDVNGVVTATGQPSASATQSDTGVSAARVGEFLANGQPENLGVAGTSITQVETNTSGGPLSYELDFSLTNMFLDVNGDFGGANFGANPFETSTTGAIGASLSYSIRVNGNEVFSVGAQLFGGNGQYQTANVIGLTGVLTGASSLPSGGERFEIAPLQGTIQLGALNPFEMLEVRAEMNVTILGGAFENFMLANIGDPNTIATGAIRAVPPPQIPLPASAFLLLSALGALGATKLRRKA